MRQIVQDLETLINYKSRGSCTAFAYLFCQTICAKGSKKYKVIEGLIGFNGETSNHTWIAFGNEIIDPTLQQFSFSKTDKFERIILNIYSPKAYLKLNGGEITIYRDVLK